MGLSPNRFRWKFNFLRLSSSDRLSYMESTSCHTFLPIYHAAQATTTFLFTCVSICETRGQLSEWNLQKREQRQHRLCHTVKLMKSSSLWYDLNLAPSSTHRHPSPKGWNSRNLELKSQACVISRSRAPSWTPAELQDEEDIKNVGLHCSKKDTVWPACCQSWFLLK